MGKSKTMQARVADEALERDEAITIGGVTYNVAPPSTATLILVSEAVAELPEMRLDSESLVTDMIREAKNCRPIGKAVATLITGAKRIKKDAEMRELAMAIKKEEDEKPLLKRLFQKKDEEKEALIRLLDEKPLIETLSDELLYAPPAELQAAMAALITRMQLGDFFGLTTFLNGINMTRPTREVAKKTRTTASGR